MKKITKKKIVYLINRSYDDYYANEQVQAICSTLRKAKNKIQEIMKNAYSWDTDKKYEIPKEYTILRTDEKTKLTYYRYQIENTFFDIQEIFIDD